MVVLEHDLRSDFRETSNHVHKIPSPTVLKAGALYSEP